MTVKKLTTLLSKYPNGTRVEVFGGLALKDEPTSIDDVRNYEIFSVHDVWHHNEPHDTVCIQIVTDWE